MIGAGVVAAGTLFFEADGLNSVTSLSGTSGLTDTYTYTTFGATTATGTNGNRFRYTGREWDQETGLYYYRARYYAPELGRFITEDPMGAGGGINLLRTPTTILSCGLILSGLSQEYRGVRRVVLTPPVLS